MLAGRRFHPCFLDRLIGTRTFGNNSLAVNQVLYLGGRTDVEEFLAATALTGAACKDHASLDTLITPGLIDDAGAISHRDKATRPPASRSSQSAPDLRMYWHCSLRPGLSQVQRLLSSMEHDALQISRSLMPSLSFRISSSSRKTR